MNTPFIWESNKNQVYTSVNGSQVLTGEGGNFAKPEHFTFTMDAPDEELTLRPVGGDVTWDGNITIGAGKVLVDCQGNKVNLNASGLDIGRLQSPACLEFYRPGSIFISKDDGVKLEKMLHFYLMKSIR